MGCLTLPFRLLGCLVMIGLLVLGWFYRDELAGAARGLYDRASGRPAAVRELPGRPSAAELRSAERKIAALTAGRADSVVLTADDLGLQLTREGSMLDDVHADPEQLSHLFRCEALLPQKFARRMVCSSFHRVSSWDVNGGYQAVQPPST